MIYSDNSMINIIKKLLCTAVFTSNRRQIDITTYQIRKIKADTSLCLFADEISRDANLFETGIVGAQYFFLQLNEHFENYVSHKLRPNCLPRSNFFRLRKIVTNLQSFKLSSILHGEQTAGWQCTMWHCKLPECPLQWVELSSLIHGRYKHILSILLQEK